MEFSKHLGKGLWGIADKALPAVYGVAYVLLVIRVLPEEEFGSFVLVQEIFLVLSNLAAAFALHPLLKFGSEASDDQRDLLGATLIFNLIFLLLSSILVMALRGSLALVLKAPAIEGLMIAVPAMLAANFIRNYTLILLQTRFELRRVFWIDAGHFLGAPLLIYAFSRLGRFNSASDLVEINVISLTFSSILGLWLGRHLLRAKLLPQRAELRRVWDYGKYSLGNIVGYLFYSRADSFFLSSFGGPAAVALYNSIKVFVRLFDTVPQVVQMFVLPAISKLHSLGDKARMTVLVEKAITFTTVVMSPVFFLLLLFSPQMIAIIYGGRYGEAAPLLQILSVGALLTPIIAVASNALMGLGEVRLNFILNFKTFLFLLVAYLILIPWLGPLGASLGFVAASLVQGWLFTSHLVRLVPITPTGVWSRLGDIKAFVRSRLAPRSERHR
jgi:lipopolysaccharide exporter